MRKIHNLKLIKLNQSLQSKSTFTLISVFAEHWQEDVVHTVHWQPGRTE